MAVSIAQFEAKGFEVFGTGSDLSNARLNAYRQLMAFVDTIFHTKMGMTRVDNNGTHNGTSGYYYQSYINRGSENNTVYLTVRTENQVNNSTVGLYIGITSSAPTDSTSTVTTSPYVTKRLNAQNVQTGSQYTFSIFGEYMLLINDEVSMCNFANSFSNYSAFCCGDLIGEGIFWTETSAIYYPDGNIKYLGYIGQSHYVLADDYSYLGGVESHSDVLVCSAPITANSNRTAGLNYDKELKEILGFCGGAFSDGDFIQVKDPEIVGYADYYFVYRYNLFLFDVQDIADWGNDS